MAKLTAAHWLSFRYDTQNTSQVLGLPIHYSSARIMAELNRALQLVPLKWRKFVPPEGS